MRSFKSRVGVAVFGATLLLTSQANAITIIGTFVPAGGSLPFGNVTTAAPSMVGGGTLSSIFNAAASYWEQAIGDTFTVNISYGWTSLSSGVLGQHSLVSQGGSPNRETAGQIEFDSDGSSSFFADSTPFDNSEYTTYNEFSADLGGGTMNTGRVYTGATGSAAGRIDLFSVALHEIGHSLGLSSANNSFTVGSSVNVTSPRPFAGASLPTVSGAHLNLTNALMFPSVSNGRRNLLSDADIIANMEISKFTQYKPVPEPASMAALGLGVAALIRKRRKKV